MSENKMDYVLQSYFKSICKSYYIAYEQVKRLEKEAKWENVEKYIFWKQRLQKCTEERDNLIKEMKSNNINIIVTEKEEVFTLLEFYIKESIHVYNIINVDEEALKAFPKEDELCNEFLNTYINPLYISWKFEKILKRWNER